jgi:hypothetical protein
MSTAALNSETAKMIRRLSLQWEDDKAPSTSAEVARIRSPPGALLPVVTMNNATRRSTYKFLSEMPDEDWGIPDACLQKTAEVRNILNDNVDISLSSPLC